MQYALATVALSLSASAVGFTLPFPMKRDSTLTVTTDNSTASVTIPSANVTTIATESTSAGDDADAAGAIADVVNQVYQYIQGIVDSDINKRMDFTKRTVAQVRQDTGLNVVMSNVGYTFTGTPFSKTSVKYKAKIGADVSYDVLTFTKGTFTLNDNGGFQNWAYIINTSCTQNKAKKTFTC